jgi:hypothetical protein
VDGTTVSDAMDNFEEMFSNLRQGPIQNIAVFNKEFDTYTRCIKIARAPSLDTNHLPLKLLKKLDQARHGTMFVYLMNGRSAGRVFPCTVDYAYAIAKEWKSASIRVADSRGIVANGAAFMLADDVRALVVVPPAATTPRKSPIKSPTKEKHPVSVSFIIGYIDGSSGMCDIIGIGIGYNRIYRLFLVQ